MRTDKALLRDMLKHETDDMPAILASLLKSMGCKVHVDKWDNVRAVKGNAQAAPLLIAHTDTVRKKPPVHVACIGEWLIALDDKGRQDILGADDRAGCTAILQIIPHLMNCTALFCSFEEMGAIGAGRLDLEPLQKACIALELDRRMQAPGEYDAIWISNSVTMASSKCKQYLKDLFSKHGYRYNEGTFTDIGTLKERGLKPSAFNLSVGYTREHSTGEALHIPSYEKALDCALDIARACNDLSFPHEAVYEGISWPKIRYSETSADRYKGLSRRERRKLRRQERQTVTGYYEDTMYSNTYGPCTDAHYSELDECHPCDGCGANTILQYQHGLHLCPACIDLWR